MVKCVMRILIACEFSGIVRDAFIRRGHEAVSCDLLPTEAVGPHIQDDVRNHLSGWDMMIAFPPCTHLAVSGARWFKDKKKEQEEALDFVRTLMDAPIERVCIENPISIISTKIRKPDQIIQPWMFGHGETKATCLWLRNLSSLVPTDIVEGRTPRVHYASPGPDRWKERSRTLPGIAEAMASQWGDLTCPVVPIIDAHLTDAVVPIIKPGLCDAQRQVAVQQCECDLHHPGFWAIKNPVTFLPQGH